MTCFLNKIADSHTHHLCRNCINDCVQTWDYPCNECNKKVKRKYCCHFKQGLITEDEIRFVKLNAGILSEDKYDPPIILIDIMSGYRVGMLIDNRQGCEIKSVSVRKLQGGVGFGEIETITQAILGEVRCA